VISPIVGNHHSSHHPPRPDNNNNNNNDNDPNNNGGGDGGDLKSLVPNVSFSPDVDPDGLLTLVEATDVKVRTGEKDLADALEESLKMHRDGEQQQEKDGEQQQQQEEGEFSTELRADVSFRSEGEEQVKSGGVGDKDSLKQHNPSVTSENSCSGAAISVNDNDKELFAKVNMIQNGLQTDMVYGKTVEVSVIHSF